MCVYVCVAGHDHPLDLSLQGVSRWGVRGGCRGGLDPPGPHVGQELVGNLR